jgi:hypothetical protein
MTSTGNPRTRDRLRSLQIPTTHLSQPLPADPRPTLTGSSSGPIARAATSAWMVGGSGTSSNPASTASRRFNAASADARRASSTSARAEQSSMNSRGVCPPHAEPAPTEYPAQSLAGTPPRQPPAHATQPTAPDAPPPPVQPPRVLGVTLRDTSPQRRVALLQAANSSRYHAALVLIAATGLRRGEALALHWEDVDLEVGTLRVRGTLARIDGELVVSAPKTARSRRTVPLALPSSHCYEPTVRPNSKTGCGRRTSGRRRGTCSPRRRVDRSSRVTPADPAGRSVADRCRWRRRAHTPAQSRERCA